MVSIHHATNSVTPESRFDKPKFPSSGQPPNPTNNDAMIKALSRIQCAFDAAFLSPSSFC
jgi:hypothetical protein